jgi:hypothetical protein
MNPEEARNVLWLRNNPRPLGELLDEGYLNQSRLQWAAEKAYDPTLKQAAQVILKTENHPVLSAKEKKNSDEVNPQDPNNLWPIGIPLEKARATLWPYGPNKNQPMGKLMESRQITLKDLGTVAENSWDSGTRQAAIALMLLRLEQAVKEPAPPAGFVKIVSGGRTYSKKKQYSLALIEGSIFGLSLGILLSIMCILAINGLKPHTNSQSVTSLASTPFGLLALAIVLIMMLLVVGLLVFIPDQVGKRLDKQIESFRLGEEGEERTVQMIVQALDGNWSLFRNVTLPGRNKGDLDIVLVGPPGVWVLEVKNLRGQYRNIGETWEYRHGKNWKTASANPGRQAKGNAGRLGSFLQADHIKTWVNPTVVWANEESPLHVENPSAAVWMFNRLPDELGNIWQSEKLTKEERSKIVEKLNKLCEVPKNAD